MVAEIKIPPSLIYWGKSLMILGIIFFPMMIFFGIYYRLSAYVNKKLKILLLSRLKKNPDIVKYLFVITIIVKFVIFFGLLKLILQVLITYIFFDFEEPGDLNCEMAEMAKTLSTVISIIFFIIYESILLPFNLIDTLEATFSLLIKFLQKMLKYLIDSYKTKNNNKQSPENKKIYKDKIQKLGNLNTKLDILDTNITNKANKDIEILLNNIAGGMAEGTNSYFNELINFISSIISKFSKEIPINIDEQFENNKNTIASNISGKLTIPLLYLGIIYLAMYYLFSGNMFVIRIIIFIILVIISMVYIYPRVLISLGRGVGIGVMKVANNFMGKGMPNMSMPNISGMEFECTDSETKRKTTCISKNNNNASNVGNAIGSYLTNENIGNLNKTKPKPKNTKLTNDVIKNLIEDFQLIALDFKDVFYAFIAVLTSNKSN